jgi:2-polyprenyl-6-methoxyphenol hydroxylase-like FAD-dependent oxidoreductase
MVLERREFLQILYDQLPDKSYIKTSSGVKAIKEIPGGVEVTLTNGDVETGDIVLGADGVYSMVRSIMWEQANKAQPGLITVQEKTSEYVCFTRHSQPPHSPFQIPTLSLRP